MEERKRVGSRDRDFKEGKDRVERVLGDIAPPVEGGAKVGVNQTPVDNLKRLTQFPRK